MPNAYLALILHAHLPYVPPSQPEALEERWLYQAVSECYLPLLLVLRRLQQGRVPVRLTVSLSAPLLDMLDNPAIRARLGELLGRSRRLAANEVERLAGDASFAPAARFYRDRLVEVAGLWDELQGDLPGAFGALAEAGLVELCTAAGAHNLLPLLQTAEGRRAAVEAACRRFASRFGRRPRGLWLPECAYAPGIDHTLAAAGVEWCQVEYTAARDARPPAPGAPHVPVLTPGGVAAFGRDDVIVQQVWNMGGGYPADPVYREFYKDIGWDLPVEYLQPYLLEGRVRHDLGFKYYRVTDAASDLSRRAPYDPAAAFARAADHGRHFAHELRHRAAGVHGGPLFVAPFDLELFGHWWLEGLAFLESALTELARAGVEAVTPSGWLERFPAAPVAQLPASTWGTGASFYTWLSPANEWVAPAMAAAESAMVGLADRHRGATGDTARALAQAGRELLLLQASDWPFQIEMGTARDYAQRRLREHLDGFWDLAAPLGAGEPVDQDRLTQLEQTHPVFPELTAELWAPVQVQVREPLRVLMLSWEYPPANTGGLGRHVHGLSQAMARRGVAVRVVTLADATVGPGISREEGVEVERVERPLLQDDFLGWVYRANLAMAVAGRRGERPHLVHAHDWLAGQAGVGVSTALGVPLVATVHATEHGRNAGIHDELQAAIHLEEHSLTAAAVQVITVSRAMAAEVGGLFKVPAGRLHAIANGVVPPQPALAAALRHLRERFAPGGAPLLVFVGRMVQEKGLQIAIEALTRLPHDLPAHLVCIGDGPARPHLEQQAWAAGLGHRVHFTGRISDGDRDAILQGADIGLVPSLYEPFGIVALEIMAAALPCIASSTGGLAEIIHSGKDGLLVAPGDAGALAQAIATLLTDRTLMIHLKQAGVGKAMGEFSWAGITTQTLAVYSRLWQQVPLAR